MINITLSNRAVYEEKVQGFVVFCEQDSVVTHPAVIELERFYKPLKALIGARGFTGKQGKSLVVAGDDAGQPVYLMMYGLGNFSALAPEDQIEQYRRALGLMVRSVEQLKISRLAVGFPDPALFGVTAYTLAQETMSTCQMANFHFNRFMTDAQHQIDAQIELVLCVPDYIADESRMGCQSGQYIGYAVNQARDWCDLPGNVITPTTFAQRCEQIAETHGLKITVFNKEDIIEKNMGGIYAVAKGSAEEPRLVIMEYQSGHPNAPTVALVGKGITFDSGGLSLKPAVSMETMKDDMAGAVVVISALEALAHLKPHINVIAAAPLAENMPSGTATRPGDIITFYNGMTAEVKNTDAEGRLVLADALSYLVAHYKLDCIIDFATLTGSCAAALGPFYAGMMTKDDALAQQLIASSQRSGDRIWRLPFHDDYKVAIQSSVADLCNIGQDKYRAGAITAGFFLSNFVGTVPWAHFDIAGTAFNVPDMSYLRSGATGFGVRLCVDLARNWPV